jgi:hypothetical protein
MQALRATKVYQAANLTCQPLSLPIRGFAEGLQVQFAIAYPLSQFSISNHRLRDANTTDLASAEGISYIARYGIHFALTCQELFRELDGLVFESLLGFDDAVTHGGTAGGIDARLRRTPSLHFEIFL